MLAVDAFVDRSKVKAVVVGGRVGGARDLPPLICLAGAGRAFGLGAWMGVVGCCDDDDDVRWAGCCWDHVLAAGRKCKGDGRPAFFFGWGFVLVVHAFHLGRVFP